MGLIGKIKTWFNTTLNSAKISEIKAGIGGTIKTLLHSGSIGEDAQALPGDYVVTIKDARTGRETIVGYIDPANPQTASAGEKIIYGRDSGGALVNRFWLKNDGEIVVNNANGTLTIAPSGAGTFDLTSLAINCNTEITGNLTLNGNYESTGTMTNNGKNVGDTHGHTQANDGGGDAEAPIVGVT